MKNFVVFILVVAVLYAQSQNELWRHHLVSDLSAFQNVALGHADPAYLPGGLLFMMLPALFSKSLSGYIQIFILINCALLFVHFYIYKKFGSPLVFLGILLASGPILLFRFELLVSLFVLLSVIFWEKKRYLISLFFLGLGVSTKFYPLVLFPYFFLLLLRKRDAKALIKMVLAFVGGVLLTWVIFLCLGGRLDVFMASLSSNSSKPIGIESIPGTILTIKALITSGAPPGISVGGGVWGLTGGASGEVVTILQGLLMAGFYGFLYLKNRMKEFSVGVVFLLILLFLILSKNLNPQYLYWFILVFPIIKYNTGMAFLVLLISLLNQLIFPLLFTQLLNFFNTGSNIEVFYIQIFKNIALILLFILGTRYIFQTARGQREK